MKSADSVNSGIQFDRQYLREVYVDDSEDAPLSEHLHAVLDVRWRLNAAHTKCAVQMEAMFSEVEDPTPEQVRVRIVLEALFSAPGEASVKLSSFARVQAPVIMMPFLREHVAAITSRTRMGQLLINPLNLSRAMAKADEQEQVEATAKPER